MLCFFVSHVVRLPLALLNTLAPSVAGPASPDQRREPFVHGHADRFRAGQAGVAEERMAEFFTILPRNQVLPRRETLGDGRL